MVNTGLEGVKVVTQAITLNDPVNGLLYRGYPVNQLAGNKSFDEAVFLMHHERLPSQAELIQFRKDLHRLRVIPKEIKQVLQFLPASSRATDVIRTVVSILGSLEPETKDYDRLKIVRRLAALQLPCLAYWFYASRTKTQIEVQTLETDSMTENFLKLMFKGRNITENEVKALDVYCYLNLDNELNASTFAARVTTSTIVDIYASLTAGMAAIVGAVHGGAIDISYNQAMRFKTPEEAEVGVREMFKQKQVVYGFGHRVYKKGDPRAIIGKKYAKMLSEGPNGMKQMFAVQEKFEEVMAKDKKILPNGDWYSMSIVAQLGLDPSLFSAITACCRTHGQLAHIAEQRTLKKIIRPSSEYIGPQCRPVPGVEQEEKPRL